MEGTPVDRRSEKRAAEPEPGRGGGLEHVARELERRPTAFDFFQAVRLLERLHPERAVVGDFVEPSTEVVRFRANPSLAFPASDVFALDLPDDGDARARMTVNFMGLIGPAGVLPYEYTLLAMDRRREKDHGLTAFLDLFHHRMVSLFYRAWRKYRFTADYEQGKDDRVTAHVLDLVGLGLEGYRDTLPFPDEALGYYAGLLALQPRGAAALEQLIADFFDVPATVEQFVGGWFGLPRHDQCELGEENASARLGGGAVVGDEIWDQQARVRIRLGPLPRDRFREFLPDGSAYGKLRSLVRFFAHDQYDFELQLALAADDVPGMVLGQDEGDPQPLGWATWIRTGIREIDADETVLAL